MEIKFKSNDVVSAADAEGNVTAEVDISTTEAIKAIGSNAKAGLKKAWEKAKPKLKVVAGVGAIGAAAVYAYTTLNGGQQQYLPDGNDSNEVDLPKSDYTVLQGPPADGGIVNEPNLMVEQTNENE